MRRVKGMHTKGDIGLSQLRWLLTNTDWIRNQERIVDLWNAADGMTTEESVNLLIASKEIGYTAHKVIDIIRAIDGLTVKEAVRYLEHGQEMETELRNHCDECMATLKGHPDQVYN
jgi:hypothetical protein